MVAVAVLAVAVSVAVNQVLNGGRWDLRWLGAAIVLAGLSEALDLWLGTRESDHVAGDAALPVLWPALAGQDGLPLLLDEVSIRDLGVHPSRFSPGGDGPYIPREGADDALAEALSAGDDGKRVVIVEGPRLAGVTRTLAQAARECLPDYLAVGFIPDPRVTLATMITQAAAWAVQATDRDQAAGAVLWLDGLGPDLLTQLAEVGLDDQPDQLLVLATIDTGELDGMRVPEQLTALLEQHARRVRLGTLTAAERAALAAGPAYASLLPLLEEEQGELFIGRIMVAWEPLRAALARGSSEQATSRVALLRAVTDWYRVHLPRLLTKDILKYLHQAYLHELTATDPGSPVSAAAYQDALEWAMTGPGADRPRLIDLQLVPGGQRYAPHPLLAVIADDPGEDISWPVSDVLWHYADRYFSGSQRRDIGYMALARSARHAAARLFNHPGANITPEALTQLARLFYDNHEYDGSRYWWQQATTAGHPDHAPRAMFNLGLLENEQGNHDQARHWWQQAINSGHPDHTPRAMVNLGLLEEERGNHDQARHWWQQAINSGHPDHAPSAMFNLGLLEEERGNHDQARHWWQQAINSGHPDQAPKAMVNLGVLEKEQGNHQQARHWYQQAINTRHPDHAPSAMFNLGVLEYEQGNHQQARHWYQHAITTGHPDQAPKAMVNLGVIEKEQGHYDQARHLWQQAITTGHAEMALRARQEIDALDRADRDRQRAEHFGRYGYLAYADPAMMGLRSQPPENPDPASSP